MLHGGFVEASSSPKLTTKSFRKDVGLSHVFWRKLPEGLTIMTTAARTKLEINATNSLTLLVVPPSKMIGEMVDPFFLDPQKNIRKNNLMEKI